MADYGGRGGGDSLRDALNALYPLTGLGEYTAGYPPAPPQTGAPMPSGGPVPLPAPRPVPRQVPLPMARPPGAPGPVPPGYGAPNPPGPVRPQIGMINAQGGGPVGGAPYPMGPAVTGNVAIPINPNLTLTAGGSYLDPQNYAARLGLAGSF